VRQVIEKKQGLFRMNMMGKRVNYAARSVITPDPMLNTNQVGVPFVFASKLTFPEPVNNINIDRMRQLVINGPNKHPGANFVIDNSGSRIMLSATNAGQRKHVANQLLKPSQEFTAPKIVLRHLIDGDVVLLNRQPTLHKPSIQGHIVKILQKEKTIRLHYSACKAYNADFDGDEINMHFPQSNEARSEGYHIMNAAHQYLVPKDGTPLGGLIQDHIVGAVHMTMRGAVFEKEHYQQLVFSAIPYTDRVIQMLPPAIMKPVQLWTGKQIISTVLRHCIPIGQVYPNVELKSKLAGKLFYKFPPTEEQVKLAAQLQLLDETVVVIRDGELLQGVVDKSNIGAANHSLVHCLYELYGPDTASNFLSALSKLMTIFLMRYRGFSVGVKDIVCTPQAEKARRKINKQVAKIGQDSVTATFELPEGTDLETVRNTLRTAHCKKDLFLMSSWENTVKGKLGTMNQAITTACIPYGLKHKFPGNNLLCMIESG
jgi:DNA-directed RNA polymerase I subunit RPA1